MAGWRTGKEHPTEGPQRDRLGDTHTDTERYDDRGRKDKDAGKLKISGDKEEPSMRDVVPPEDDDAVMDDEEE